MLIERIKSATDSISTKSKLQTQKLSNEKLNSRLTRIAAIGNKLDSCIETINAMQNNHIDHGTPIHEEQKTALLGAINECGRCIADLSLDDTIVSAFKMQTDVIEQLLSAHWKQAANNYSSGVVNYLTILSELTPDPKRSNELLASIKAQSTNVSPNKTLVSRFAQDVTAVQNIVDQYKLDPAIQDFLFKVKLRQASIEDLTPKVTEWLKVNNLTKKLLISF
jgi:hypothetical protein